MQFALPPLTDLAAFGFLALIVLVTIGFFGVLVYLDHRKTMALIETGQYTEATRDESAWILAAGLLLVAVGVGQAVEAVAAGTPIEGLTVAFVGVAALAYYALRRRERSSGDADRSRSHSEQ